MTQRNRYQIFVSSTYSDLHSEREKIINELTRVGYIAVGMEQFPATDEEQLEYIYKIIDESDYYIVILRGRYGSVDESGIGFTEREFDYALSTKKPVLAFLYKSLSKLTVAETDNDPSRFLKLNAFRQKLEGKRIVRYWENLPDLIAHVKDSINDIVRRRPGVGWVRGDQAIDPRFFQDLERLRIENHDLRLRLSIAENEPQALAAQKEVERLSNITIKSMLDEFENYAFGKEVGIIIQRMRDSNLFEYSCLQLIRVLRADFLVGIPAYELKIFLDSKVESLYTDAISRLPSFDSENKLDKSLEFPVVHKGTPRQVSSFKSELFKFIIANILLRAVQYNPTQVEAGKYSVYMFSDMGKNMLDIINNIETNRNSV